MSISPGRASWTGWRGGRCSVDGSAGGLDFDGGPRGAWYSGFLHRRFAVEVGGGVKMGLRQILWPVARAKVVVVVLMMMRIE